MVQSSTGYVKVGPLEALKKQGCAVVAAGGQTIAVFHHDGRVYALDNRCPHMGFPLERGSLKEGILTCHWHHARFDLNSGGTFDPWADDVQAFPVRIVDGEVWVDPAPPTHDPVAHWKGRLEDSLEHNIRLVTSKAVIALFSAEVDYRELVRIGGRFGTHYSAQGWGAALTILTSMANILPYLNPKDRPRALYQGLVHVARECSGKPPRFITDPLPTQETHPGVLKKWFRQFIEVRDAEGAERCLYTAIQVGLPPQAIADMLFAAASDHLFMDVGHSLDFANKAFELLDHVGWDEAAPFLTSLVPGLASARRGEESAAWRHPVDVASLLKATFEELPSLVEQGKRSENGWNGGEALVPNLLVDDPVASVEALKESVCQGASFEALGQTVAHAAALRLARFNTSNEFGDWDTVHHTFTYANAVHQALRRAPSVELLRSVFDAAMSIYLNRFLNVPPARFPEPKGPSSDTEGLLATFLEALNVQQQVEESSELVAMYLQQEEEPEKLMAAMGRALLREDAGFHSFQEVEAGFRQYSGLRGTEAGRHVLVGVTRFLAAHSPTSRTMDQTYRIALRLHRNEKLYE